jgi:primosomal protein N' (replication factor Y)
MHNHRLIQVAIPTPLRKCFDYLLPEEMASQSILPGMRVLAPFGRRKVVGVVIDTLQDTQVPHNKLKPIEKIIDSTPLLPASVLKLCRWASDYYQHPIGEVMAAALPSFLRQDRVAELPPDDNMPITATAAAALTLNTEQQHAVSAIKAKLNQAQTFLLDGITGSGKTEVYLQVIDTVLNAGQQAIVLVPEIALTPQTIQRFQQRFSQPVVALHSNLAGKARFTAWLQVKLGKAAIVIGTRSAIFTPLAHPGIIIIDEEHDSAFKQQEGFRYSARDLASVRSQIESIPVVLGSATPSLESYYNAQQQRYQHLTLTQRAGNAQDPDYTLLDLRQQKLQGGLSTTLLHEIKAELALGNQVLLFLNRRGFAQVLMCHQCGWHARCTHCDANLVVHQHKQCLICHHCGQAKKLITRCPECLHGRIISSGFGTEKLEKTLEKLFTDFPLIRIDRDTTSKKQSLQKLLDQVHSGHAQILIGTQMLAKGHHFPNVTLAAIVDADAGLYSADFRALEKLGQLLIQVAGRAGRAEKPGRVFLQTHQPDHPLLQTLITQGYHAFLQAIQQERQAAHLPPYGYLALLSASALQRELPMAFLREVRAQLPQVPMSTLQVLGPIPALMEKRAGRFYAQILISAPQRRSVQNFCKQLIFQIENMPKKHQVRWHIDIDPLLAS